MEFKDLVEMDEYIAFEDISEPRTNGIRLRIKINVSKNETDLLIYPDGDCNVQTLEIAFPNYVTYSVVYDNYTTWNERDEFIGNRFRIYKKSNYLNFIEKEYRLGPELSRKKLTHYSLACFEHKVDVISFDEPSINELK
ncbi:hypothetical protein ACFYKX_21125 [Cytobacillus sp. FJAT-54145]|uniref:Uncharacterized protein n=1 Tax=Cytobacillus spartinae TaxID=3299023 RepID=A0ABW6KFR1_9BACI